MRYDGIYRIARAYRKPGAQKQLVCRYLFIRCDNEPAPWSSEGALLSKAHSGVARHISKAIDWCVVCSTARHPLHAPPQRSAVLRAPQCRNSVQKHLQGCVTDGALRRKHGLQTRGISPVMRKCRSLC